MTGGIPSEELERTATRELRNSRAFYAAYSLLLGLLALVSVTAWGWGRLGGLLFGGYAIWALVGLLDRRPRVLLTGEGVSDQNFLHSPGLIPWSDIVDVRPGRWGLVTLELRDETAYWKRLSPYGKLAATKLQLFGHGLAVLQPLGLEASRAELLEALEDGMDAYMLSSAATTSDDLG